MSPVEGPLGVRRARRSLCACGEPHTVRIRVEAREKRPNKDGAGASIDSMYRSVCDACALKILTFVEEGWPR
jgi:hypothetical protein